MPPKPTHAPGDPFCPYKLFKGIWIPDWLAERPEVSMPAKFCYGAMARKALQKETFEAPIAEICRMMGCSDSTVKRSIKELIIFQLLKKHRRGFHGSDAYTFIWHAWIEQPRRGQVDPYVEVKLTPTYRSSWPLARGQVDPYVIKKRDLSIKRLPTATAVGEQVEGEPSGFDGSEGIPASEPVPTPKAPPVAEPPQTEAPAKAEGAQNGAAHAEFIAAWVKSYPEHHSGAAYVVQGGKDGSAVKKLVANLTVEKLMRIAVAAWQNSDEFNCKQAASIAGFASRINEIRAELNAKHARKKEGTNRVEGLKGKVFDPTKNP